MPKQLQTLYIMPRSDLKKLFYFKSFLKLFNDWPILSSLRQFLLLTGVHQQIRPISDRHGRRRNSRRRKEIQIQIIQVIQGSRL